MRETLILLAAILAIPIVLLAVRAIMGWRYSRLLRHATGGGRGVGPDPHRDATEVAAGRERPQLAIADLTAAPPETSPAATALVAEARASTRRIRRAFAISVGVYAVVVSAAVATSFIPGIPADARVVAIYLLVGALLIVLASALTLPWRWIGIILSAYIGLLLLSPLVASPRRILGLIQAQSALFLLIPGAVALLAARSLRPVIPFGAAIALYVLATFGIAALMAALGWAPRFDQVRPLSWTLAVGTLLGGVLVVGWMLSRRTLLRPSLVLCAATAAGAALSWLWPAGELVGAIVAGIGMNAIQLLFIWFLFRMALRLQRLRWLSWQALQVHLALALLSVYLMALLLLGEGLFVRQTWSGLAILAAYVCYVAIAHVLLTRAWAQQRDRPARRLLFLRTFGSTVRSRRLLRTLDDSWRRVGRVDLIGGIDIGIETVDARMLHAFLIRRPDRFVIRSRDDEVAAQDALRTSLEGDGRYPVNDLVCGAERWQSVVTRLAAGTHVVLMDLRGFTRQHRGCIFELTTLLSQVPLARVVIVVDGSTCRSTLEDVALAAWRQLPEVSVNATALQPRLGVLDLSSRQGRRRLFEFLAAAAAASQPAASA